MKRKLTLALSLVGVLLVGLCAGCAPSGEGGSAVQAEYNWRCADFYTEGSDTGLVVERFCDLVNGLSKGRIDLKYYGSGVLGGYEETLDACSRGEIEFCMISPYSSYHELQNLKGMPFAGTTFEKADQLFFGDGIVNQVIKDSWLELGVKQVMTIDGGMFCYCTKDAPILTPADFGTDKIRVPPADVYIRVFERLAPTAVGQVLPWGEYYSSLERGVVDGGPAFMNTYEPMKFFEVAPYFTDINQNYNFDNVLMNNDLFEGL
ncbi:MAG: TRAP transporter substrate-binding protein DctP, partial [Dehalococcoidia bacterium]|nr:TRAP transporter substrate-binding protein DctP [Dehalococcoidia bacterium]